MARRTPLSRTKMAAALVVGACAVASLLDGISLLRPYDFSEEDGWGNYDGRRSLKGATEGAVEGSDNGDDAGG
ncbi:hypothetical protein ACHAWF_014561, partial [Thalassiosira exigua]